MSCMSMQDNHVTTVQDYCSRRCVLGVAPFQKHTSTAKTDADNGLAHVSLSVILVATKCVSKAVVVHKCSVWAVAASTAGCRLTSSV